ncbi:magnesium transporter CorA family protein [Aspergillus saccharolyticus JOP 1030-1]|uniref:Magnesium and cobalt transport protein and translocase of inner mitochondrial membrane n=1 Tax=Aspergillus saccharolyticus JOP 1030-1 TaxID=1450539 RepID=A0A318ZJ28_9EURO|nr:magnesium and cobalt transport protein and translocase of inner mitochondrial membrane [Aspergillus saccharolyticus JOP 1030-1]PYH44573.1 magnesium and cobalt transport protein and translocase of inner mitochondrial membrane [Aspergillus saccharolyticus JOP 1030-1]
MQSEDNPRFTHFSCQSHKVTVASNFEGLLTDPSEQSPDINDLKVNAWWLDIRDASEEDVRVVGQALSIHPLTAEDIVTRETREKIETFRNYYLISFQTLLSATEGDYLGRSKSLTTDPRTIPDSAGFYILVFKNAIVTFSPRGCNHVSRVLDRIHRMQDPSIMSSEWICYALIDDIVDSFGPYMRAAERDCDAIEDQVFMARADDIKAIIPLVDRLHKSISQLTHCLSGKAEVLNGFVKRCQAKSQNAVFSKAEMIVYLGDVQDHLVTTLTNLSHFDEIVGRSQANFLAQMSVNNIRLSLNINEILSKVTVLASIFVPLHMITGLWGMNVPVPGQDAGGLGWFFGIVGCFVVFIIVCCILSRRLKLL